MWAPCEVILQLQRGCDLQVEKSCSNRLVPVCLGCQAVAELWVLGRCLGTCQQEADELAGGVGSASLDLILCWVWWRPWYRCGLGVSMGVGSYEVYRCGLGVSVGRQLQPGSSSFYLLVGQGKQIKEPMPAACANVVPGLGWSMRGPGRGLGQTDAPTDRVPGIVQLSSLLAVCCGMST